MKIAVAIFFFFGLFGFRGGQENPPANQAVPRSPGLEVGQQAPAFTLPDQFGHEQSKETLKGLKGTVLLFFRSADW
jgi:cytochrome oxidase Cu insertion factor (SCO1/SenC/PrrC family)